VRFKGVEGVLGQKRIGNIGRQREGKKKAMQAVQQKKKKRVTV